MRTTEIIKEIQQLPISQRMYIVEKTIHSIRFYQERNQMEIAADELYNDYASDKSLTALTNLDFDDFYEAK